MSLNYIIFNEDKAHIKKLDLGNLIAYLCLFIKIVILIYVTPVFHVMEEQQYKQNTFKFIIRNF